jgi:type I restriction enzyme S subunit
MPTGESDATGRSAVVVNHDADTVFDCHLVQGRPNPVHVSPRFLAFQLNSFGLRHHLISRANVVTMATVGQNVLSTCPVWLPTLSEQANVLKHIDEESERLDAITSRAQREISLLREYRTRLIADIVTGKLDVRAAAASLPDDTDEPEVPDDREALAEGDEDTIDGDLDVAPEEAEA